MGEHFKHLIDHAEMIMAFELPFDVDKIFVQRLKAVSEHLGNVHADRVVRLKEPAPVTYEMEGRGRYSSHARPMTCAEQHGHLTEHCAGFRDGRDGNLTLKNLDLSIDEEEQRAGSGSFLENRLARARVPRWIFSQNLEDRFHAARVSREQATNRKPGRDISSTASRELPGRSKYGRTLADLNPGEDSRFGP